MNNKNNNSENSPQNFANSIANSSGQIFKDLVILELEKIGVVGKSAEVIASQLSQTHATHLSNCLYPLVKTMEMMGVTFSETQSPQEIQNLKDSATHFESHNLFGNEDPGKDKDSGKNSWPKNFPNSDDFFGNRFMN